MMNKRKVFYIVCFIVSNLIVASIVAFGMSYQYDKKLSIIIPEYTNEISAYKQTVQNLEKQADMYIEEIASLKKELEKAEKEKLVTEESADKTTDKVEKKEVTTEKNNDKKNKTEGMIFPNSDSVLISINDLNKLTKEKCRLARNEIFARHGYQFQNEELKKYYSNFQWYLDTPAYTKNDIQSTFNSIEMQNLEMILNYEYDHFG